MSRSILREKTADFATMQSQFQKGWKGFNFSGFVKFRVFSCIARKAKVWECSAPDDTDTTAIKVAIDDVILHHVESFIIGQNYKAKILEEELNHLQIAISSPLNRILKYGISQAKDNSRGNMGCCLAHFDQNYAFIMRRLDFVLYAISILLDNRATATDVLHLSARAKFQ